MERAGRGGMSGLRGRIINTLRSPMMQRGEDRGDWRAHAQSELFTHGIPPLMI